MTSRAFTLITALSVQTGSSTTQQGVSLTFINVHAVLHHHKAALVAFKALTLKAARCVNTGALTAQVRRDSALIDVCAVSLLHGQSKAVVAATLEAADSVPACSMCAEALKHFTLIHIFIKGSSSENIPPVGESRSSGADGPVFRCSWFGTRLALQPPSSPHRATAHIHSVAARQRLSTLILIPFHIAVLTADIYAGASTLVQRESLSTFTAEGAVCVHADTVATHTREHLTLVNIFTDKPLHPRKAARAGSVNFAAFTWTTPCSTQGGAAL